MPNYIVNSNDEGTLQIDFSVDDTPSGSNYAYLLNNIGPNETSFEVVNSHLLSVNNSHGFGSETIYIYNIEGAIVYVYRGEEAYNMNTFNIIKDSPEYYSRFTPKSHLEGSILGLHLTTFGVSLAGDSPATQPSCFLSTSKILTPTGYKPVSQLKKDDLVTSLFGDVPVKRVLKSRVSNPPKENSPFLVPKDFFGPDVPSEDLWLSGWHRIFFKNNKIQTYIGVAANSVSGLIPLSIEEAMGITGEDDLFYYHLELTDRNNCLIASNLLVESFNQISSAKELDNFIHSE